MSYTYKDFVNDLHNALNKPYCPAEGEVINFQRKGLHSDTVHQFLEQFKEENSRSTLILRLYEEGAAIHIEDLPEVDEDEDEAEGR
ncbi:hypothetical protein EJC49_14895 [Aquibium carbonis]|uniref:Uncharacterized protein n=1 Tax=Aquibium carbonis TaxID=2495581 RepID=A0A3R9Y8J4_9HYPH|nr:hypothetical protein [Aquibium carbonis]RST85588.1 hypothetical protein EJC49_14895 [Aquibium carbonis]